MPPTKWRRESCSELSTDSTQDKVIFRTRTLSSRVQNGMKMHSLKHTIFQISSLRLCITDLPWYLFTESSIVNISQTAQWKKLIFVFVPGEAGSTYKPRFVWSGVLCDGTNCTGFPQRQVPHTGVLITQKDMLRYTRVQVVLSVWW